MEKKTQRPFYPDDMALLSLGYGEDIEPILRFIQYLKIKENGQRLKGDLPKGRFYMALNSAALDLKWTQSKVRRIIKKIETVGVITAITHSTTKGVPSIYQYNSVYYNNGDTNEPAYSNDSGHMTDTETINVTQTDTERDTERDTNGTAYNADSEHTTDTERDTERDESKKELKKESKNTVRGLNYGAIRKAFNAYCPNLKPLNQLTHWQRQLLDEWGDPEQMEQVFKIAGKSKKLIENAKTWANFSFVIKNRERILAGEFNDPEPIKRAQLPILN